MAQAKSKVKPLMGWREWVLLPDLSPVPIKAKIDTGARTSALHAINLSATVRNGEQWAEFDVHPLQRSKASAARVAAMIRGHKTVRSSTGHSEERPVIRTTIRIGVHEFDIDLTLTSRDEMGFRMLLGRAAVRRRFWVDAGRSYLQSPPASISKTRSEQQ